MQRSIFACITSSYWAVVAALLISGWLLDPAVVAAKQPIHFSHQTHASVNQIPCQYCHLYARRSYSSGVPPVSACIGCHGSNELKLIQPQGKSAEEDRINGAEVDKIRDYWAKQEPIPWMKIHDIPDFVRFPHKKHLNADAERFNAGAEAQCDMQKDPRSLACRIKQFKAGGDERCAACHGDIKSMAVVQVVDADFAKMGWCLTCHLNVKGATERKSAMSTLGGWFNAQAEDKIRAEKIQLKNPQGYHNPNLTDCMTCHY